MNPPGPEAGQTAALSSLVTAIAAGILLIIVARRAKLPGIVLLLLAGIVLGPEGIGLVQPESLKGVLPVIVSLAVSLILFEGGLTLDLRGYAAGSNAIMRLLTVGVLVTWLCSALAVRLIFKLDLSFALLAGSMVIVTGPTVIGPLLKRIKVVPRLHNILHWESVLVDAIGVFVATLCFEWLLHHNGVVVVINFALRMLFGLSIGVAGGFGIVFAMRRRLVPQNLHNAFAVGAAVLIFGVTEAMISQAGLLAVTIAGFVVGWKYNPGELKAIRAFKADITDLLIGMLFILLSSRLRIAQFQHFGWRGVLAVAVIMLVVRPLNILVSTTGSGLGWREKIFLSWIAPRGIVAASMASLFSIALAPRLSAQEAGFLETFVYSVIVATVVLQGFSAERVARMLGLKQPDPTGWLIVNADAFGREVARFLMDELQCEVMVLDSNSRLVEAARAEGLPALCEDALNVDAAEDRDEYQKVGHMLALTDNAELNELLCARWADALGRDDVYRWSGAAAGTAPAVDSIGQIAFAQIVRPSVIAAELGTGAAKLRVARTAGEIDGAPMIIARGEEIVLEQDALAAFQPAEGDKCLWLERSGNFLQRSLAAGGVIDLPAGALIEVYKQLVDFVIERNPAVSKEQSLNTMIEAGALVPAWLGHGVAVPHLYSAQISHRVCVLARLRDGLRVPDQDEPLRLLFFLVSPAGDPEGHLATLAEIARFCADPARRKALIEFSSPEDASRFLRARSEV